MECDILGAVAPYAARIISHTSPWWAAGNDLMVGEDMRKENRLEETLDGFKCSKTDSG